MKRALVAATALLLMAPHRAPAEVSVTANGDRVTVTARQAPLAEVLQQIGRSTGMKVEFEGQQPRTPLTLSIVNESLVSAVGRVLEGAGVDFAFTLDPTEQKVVKLLLLGRSSTDAAAATARNQTRSLLRQQQQEEAALEEELPPDIDPGIQEPAADDFQLQDIPPDATPAVPLIPGAIPGAPAPAIPGVGAVPGAPSTGPTPLPVATPRLPTYQPFAQPTPSPAPAQPAPVPSPTPSQY